MSAGPGGEFRLDFKAELSNLSAELGTLALGAMSAQLRGDAGAGTEAPQARRAGSVPRC